jgi:hypothetical protein
MRPCQVRRGGRIDTQVDRLLEVGQLRRIGAVHVVAEYTKWRGESGPSAQLVKKAQGDCPSGQMSGFVAGP